jgi:bifunctional non-homologous end joining protein LigD
MSLKEYRKKRVFSETPEPSGSKATASSMRFVVQEHHARRLHYDLRLEADGVLKSWAVPRRPSMNPKDKRLAIQVEDHPVSYINFEGEIPKGNYGAGTVIVWDNGKYGLADNNTASRKRSASVSSQIRKGELQFELKGKKLKGAFTLVRLKGKEKEWLLIKQKDGLAENGKATGKTNRSKSRVSKKAIKKSAKTKATPLKPMLATLAPEPELPDEGDWLYEIKWDGYRAIAVCRGKDVQLYSRNLKSFNNKYPPVVDALKEESFDAVLDGEIIVVSSNGQPKFQDLQQWRSVDDGQLQFQLFDLLHINGQTITDLPLRDRRDLLETLINEGDLLRISSLIDAGNKDPLAWARKKKLEGIMAKKADSIYTPGERSQDWQKIKLRNAEEVLIIGYAKKNDSPRAFSSLLAASYQGSELVYAGRIGTGFSDSQLNKLQTKLNRLKRKSSPLSSKQQSEDEILPDRRPGEKITWVSPQLVVVVEFAELTDQGIMRHASFQGLRTDKNPKQVQSIRDVKSTARSVSKKGRLDFEGNDENEMAVAGIKIQLTNLQKIYWPKEGYSKGDLLNYYHEMAPTILPYIVNRAQSLLRSPGGITKKSFYQKDITGKVPDWMQQHPYVTGEGEKHHFLIPKSEADLLFMVNWGTIEINPASNPIDQPDAPSWCILDLDPGKKSSFQDAVTVARSIGDILQELGISGYPKTSGATGIHIYLPMKEKYSYDEVQLFAKIIAQEAVSRQPKLATIERLIRNRKGLLYVDFLQNRYGATLAAPYSVRPRPGAPVSMPLDWSELNKKLDPLNFTMANAVARVKKNGDIFRKVLGRPINIEKVLSKLNPKNND